MLTVYRSNRAEWLASILSEELRLEPPKLFETVDVIVNTWPTSRWLSEQFAMVNGISALIKYPFPSSHLKKLSGLVLGTEENSKDPWKADRLVWTLLDLLPELLEKDEAAPLKEWLSRQPSISGQLNQALWQLAHNIANAFEDYALFRPELMTKWLESVGSPQANSLSNLPAHQNWQAILISLLVERLDIEPFGLQFKKAIEKLKRGESPAQKLPNHLHIFGLSSLAPIQMELIQALSGLMSIKIYLLTPCPDLWKRCKERRETLGNQWNTSLDGNWLRQAPRLEANLGRMGAEFQQLLEGSGESQLGEWKEGDLFAAPANIAIQSGRKPTFLEQLQQHLVNSENDQVLFREEKDNSLIFLSCPGQARQVQVIRDQILQLLAKDKSLEPRDILIMTPQVQRFAPLIASILNDKDATGVDLPWRITDRSQLNNPGLIRFMLDLLKLAGSRLTSISLDSLLSNPAFQKQQKISPGEVSLISNFLQLTGFSWGLDAHDRNGDETHSLSWCLDRWLLGLILPSKPGIKTKGAAPFSEGIKPTEVIKWWNLLSLICNQLRDMRHPHRCEEWVKLLKSSIDLLFLDGGAWNWERQSFLAALEDWHKAASISKLKIEAKVVEDVLNKALTVNIGRFGHRSGALTISALEPMRAIPHRVIVLMGLDADIFPRHNDRPGFHLLEHNRLLGDPSDSDQDRYVLLEALMSCRQHLLISWNSTHERTGEFSPAANPVQQWLGQLEAKLEPKEFNGLIRQPEANPLNRNNFLIHKHHQPISCDRRNLEARLWLEKKLIPKPLALALPLEWDTPKPGSDPEITQELLRTWLIAPQLTWLQQFQLNPREWSSPIKELEDLVLNELQRHKLLKSRFEELLDFLSTSQNKTLKNSIKGNWEHDYEGQGKFPTKAAGQLEMEILENRWQDLQSTLLNLGPCKKSLLDMKNDSREILWAGDYAVVIELGKLKAKSVMGGWLKHLQVCAYNSIPVETIIIARNLSPTKKDQFHVALRWKPIKTEQAQSHIKTLKSIANLGLRKCWPIPPESGWALAKAKHKNPCKGLSEFQKKWNSQFKVEGEREKAEMQLCFGTDFEAEDFLQNNVFKEAFTSLYDPLINLLA